MELLLGLDFGFGFWIGLDFGLPLPSLQGLESTLWRGAAWPEPGRGKLRVEAAAQLWWQQPRAC